ncbi:MAPEG family protein [Thiohalorhabdus methylotrophus]|uniref:MAPEG family protein n=1 Tax=Thiohalorhabdus methylotrophus TaxID=3242694 RepID=A0ABV4TS91_9GAMM
MPVSITSLYAALNALVLIGLAIRVSAVRRAAGINIGTGAHPGLERAVRAHANAAENIPMGMVLLLTLELVGGAAWLLHACGSLFVAGRVLHGWGLNRSAGASFGRVAGMTLTWGIMAALAAANLLALAGLPAIRA